MSLSDLCGIFASAGFAPDRGRISIVAHRGPDGEGWRDFTSGMGPVALGHRRLAVIDTSAAGEQPFVDESGRYHLTYNGEIYNYRELRDELKAAGAQFKTATDTEVLLCAWRQWGVSALSRFVGMFAFAIWDQQEHRLFVARDRFGIKPLYWSKGNGGIAFGSEIKQLLDLPGTTRRANLARVHDFLADGISDHTSETLFDGIHQLRGGEYGWVAADRHGQPELQIQRWNDVQLPAQTEIGEAEAGARFRDLLEQSVRLHLRADVRVGSCLSGGLDSSSIVCLMARMLPADGFGLHSFSACYADRSVDEKPFMDIAVKASGATPHFLFPRAEDVFESARDITWHQDEPFGSTSIFAQWCVFAEARKAGVTVMLDGQGADEMLAGYHGCYPMHLSELARSYRFSELARTIAGRAKLQGVSARSQVLRLLYALAPSWLSARVRRQHIQTAHHDWLASEAFATLGNPPTALQTAASALDLEKPDGIAALCNLMVHGSNLPMLLHWEDRNSMAHGIEARVPFLDHRLVEFALKLGNQHKLVGTDTKRVLRTGMAGILPEAIRQRKDKLGFATPETTWFRGPLRELMTEGVEATLRNCPGLLNAAGARRKSAAMLDGSASVDFSLWRMVNVGLWAELFGVSLG